MAEQKTLMQVDLHKYKAPFKFSYHHPKSSCGINNGLSWDSRCMFHQFGWGVILLQAFSSKQTHPRWFREIYKGLSWDARCMFPYFEQGVGLFQAYTSKQTHPKWSFLVYKGLLRPQVYVLILWRYALWVFASKQWFICLFCFAPFITLYLLLIHGMIVFQKVLSSPY